MKRKYMHMSMLINGPKQPSNGINLYLKLLKDELDTLWAEEGVKTWDAFDEQYFHMSAFLLCTVKTCSATDMSWAKRATNITV